MEEKLTGWRILTAVDEIVSGVSARARAKAWSSGYSFEALLLEMMAQTGGLVIGAAKDFKTNLVFAKVENAVFAPSSAPGSELAIAAQARDGIGEQGTWIEAEVLSGNDKIASAKLFLIDAGDLDGSGKSVTFHDGFLDYYKVRGKIK